MDVIVAKKHINEFAVTEVESRRAKLQERPCAGVVIYDSIQSSPMSWKLLANPDRQLYDNKTGSLVSVAIGVNDKSEAMAMLIMTKLLRLLVGLHNRGVVHGLLGPDTVYLHSATGELYITEAPLTLSLFPPSSSEYKRRATLCAPEFIDITHSTKSTAAAAKAAIDAPWGRDVTADPRLRVSSRGGPGQRVVTPAADIWGCAVVILSMLLPLKNTTRNSSSSSSRPSSSDPPLQKSGGSEDVVAGDTRRTGNACGASPTWIGPRLSFDREDCEDADIMCPLFSTVSPGVVSVLVRCLKKNPDQRPSVEEFLCELDPDLRIERMKVLQRQEESSGDDCEEEEEEEEEEAEEEEEDEEDDTSS